MRILYICHHFATFILYEIIELKKKGHDIFILGEDSSQIYEIINKPLLEQHGLAEHFHRFFITTTRKQKYIEFFSKLMGDFMAHPIYASKACFYIMKNYPNPKYGVIDYLDIQKFFDSGVDIVHAPVSTPHMIDKVSLVAKILNVPYTLSFKAHDIWQGDNLAASKKKIKKIREASRIFTIATFNRTYLHSQIDMDKDIEVIHDAIDLEFFRPNNVEKSRNSIVAVSRFSPEKGLIYLLKACHILNQRQINYHCTLIGDGPEKYKYEKLIVELEIPNIHFAGFLSHDQVKEHLQSTAVFVLPSLIDSDGLGDVLPNGVKEAMAMQVPVITSNIRGIEELVINGVNGILVDPGDSDAIADAIERIFTNPDQGRKMGEEGRKKIEQDFNIKTEVGKIEEIFEKSLSLSI